MKGTLNRLSARKAETLKSPGRHAGGGNLYLAISKSGTRRWVFMYSMNGKQREMGLGGAGRGGIPIATARIKAAQARASPAAGIEPILAKQEAERRAAMAQAPTFGKMTDDYMAAMKPSWRSARHA